MRTNPALQKMLISLVFFWPCVVTAQQLGQVVEGHLEITTADGSRIMHSLPLPIGRWHVASVVTRNARTLMKDILLLQEDKSVLSFAIFIAANAATSPGRWTDEPCRVETYNHRNDFGTRLWKQRCLIVRPSTFTQNASQSTNDALAFMSSRNIKHDYNSVLARYSDFDERGRFVQYDFYIFPSNHGLDNPQNAAINLSPYHPISIQRDPAKQQFMAAAIEYGEMLAQSVSAAMNSAGGGSLPSFVYPRGEVPIATQPSNPSGSIEQRLQTLKRAFDANLLTESEYKLKRSQILDSL